MAVLGNLMCRTCKEKTCVGKWLRTNASLRTNGGGFGFWRGNVSYEELGLKVLHFLARHTNHDILMLSDGQYDKLSETEPFHEYRNVEDELRIDWPADAAPQKN